MDESYFNHKTKLITTELLEKTKMPREGYENSDGSPLIIDTDYFGNERATTNPSAGPFENPRKGLHMLKVW